MPIASVAIERVRLAGQVFAEFGRGNGDERLSAFGDGAAMASCGTEQLPLRKTRGGAVRRA